MISLNQPVEQLSQELERSTRRSKLLKLTLIPLVIMALTTALFFLIIVPLYNIKF